MGRVYAGILGPLAFATILARSLVDGAGVESTVKIATVCLFAFAAIGYVAGRIADLIVTESVRTRFQAELQVRTPSTTTQAPTRS